MTDDMEDPVTRETMALEWIVESWHSHPPEFTSPPTMDEVRQMLQVLDSFDPLRAMLPEVVAAMEYALPSLDYDTDRLLKGDYYGAGIKALAKLDEFRYLLSKLRKLTPTKGGTDDDAQ